jgi:hypothetical protein
LKLGFQYPSAFLLLSRTCEDRKKAEAGEASAEVHSAKYLVGLAER